MTKSEIYKYDSSKDIICLPGEIFGPKAKRNILFVFDPGAFRTIISTEVIDALGYQATSTSRRVSASSVIGIEHGYTVKVKRLKVLKFDFFDFEIVAMDLPEKYEIDGLLGLDLLEKFEVTLKHRDHKIRFKLL